MKFLQTWAGTSMAGAIGWTLFHSLWEGAIISAALAAALVVLRSPRARYAVACVAMLVMLGGFGLTLVRVMPEHAHDMQTVGPPAVRASNVPSGMDAATRWNPSLAAVVPWFAPFWIAGVWIFYFGHVVAWIGVRRLRRRGVCCAPERWQKDLGRLGVKLRLSRPVLLLESCIADAPLVFGHFRPVILMPIGLLAGLPAGQIEVILLHELAHIRRYDYLSNLLQRSVEGLFFYHPAAWWISWVIRAERENCCDDVVVATSGNAHEYAVALAALEQNRCFDREPAVAATGGSLMRRIRRLLYPRGPNSAWTPFFAAAIVIATATVTLVAWQTSPQPSPKAAQPQADHTETSPYLKWLNEDVVYIISDKERAVFQRLSSNEERETFIEQFWLRRDPTPGTPENEYQAEHYRRIAYANEHFASINLDGWKADRGRIYIIWGPPDEIDSHPSGGPYERPPAEGGGTTSTFPFEDWRYRHVEGLGDNIMVEFVDKTGTGEFKMTMDPHEKETAYVPSEADSYPQSRPRGIFVSSEPGSKVTVEITPDRRMLISIPIDFDAKQYFVTGATRASDGRTSRVEFKAVVSLCKNFSSAPACLEGPVFRPDLATPGRAALDPGSYVFNAIVKDLVGIVEKTYIVNFEVN
jgi:GWxTD domain-containing protein